MSFDPPQGPYAVRDPYGGLPCREDEHTYLVDSRYDLCVNPRAPRRCLAATPGLGGVTGDGAGVVRTLHVMGVASLPPPRRRPEVEGQLKEPPPAQQQQQCEASDQGASDSVLPPPPSAFVETEKDFRSIVLAPQALHTRLPRPGLTAVRRWARRSLRHQTAEELRREREGVESEEEEEAQDEGDAAGSSDDATLPYE